MAQSITFRLADSLPRAVVVDQLAGRTKAQARERYEGLLDAGYGDKLLSTAAAAAIVQDALLHFDGVRYRIHAWCVMPNHVHVLATPMNGVSLSSILHTWKSFTAKRINDALGRSGPLWWEEYYDRVIRDADHFEIVRFYIENNPVKAGLCARPTDWPYSSARRPDPEKAGETPALP